MCSSALARNSSPRGVKAVSRAGQREIAGSIPVGRGLAAFISDRLQRQVIRSQRSHNHSATLAPEVKPVTFVSFLLRYLM